MGALTMINELSRRNFLRITGLGTITSAMATSCATDKSLPITKPSFNLGLCSYSLRAFKVDEAIEMTRKVGLEYISLKDFHLSLNSDNATIMQTIEKFTKAGITVYACGVVYMKNKDEINRAFDYAKSAGIKIIVGVPPHELLETVHEKVKEYDIKVAIHNHGPGDKLYPTSDSAYQRIRHMDKRMGLCMDIGHTQRSGQNPADEILKYADRMLDFHIKDVSEASAKGSGVVVGAGVIDIPAVLNALSQINYRGIAAFEYEKDSKDPMPGLTQSVEYVRKLMTQMQV